MQVCLLLLFWFKAETTGFLRFTEMQTTCTNNSFNPMFVYKYVNKFNLPVPPKTITFQDVFPLKDS